jgi:alpha-1,2-mannosyltransferase
VKVQFTAAANRIVLLGIIALLIAPAVPFLLREKSEWELVYIQAARDLLAGADIYAQGRAYLYPPFMTLLAAPFAFLPHFAARGVWYVVNILSIGGLLGLSWRLSGGTALRLIFYDRRNLVAAVLGVACSERYISNALSHQQTDILVACLIMAGLVALMQQRKFVAGALLGIAAACKATPMLFAPYLAWRRQWVAAAILVLVAIGLNLGPNLIHATPEGGTWLGRWLFRYVIPVHHANVYPGTWGAASVDNQSLAGFLGRVATTNWTWSSDGVDIVVRDPLMGPFTVRVLVTCVLLVLFATSLWAAGQNRRIEWHIGDNDVSTARPVLEFGIILCLMLLSSPMSSRAHFATLILPAFCVARYALQSHDRTIWGLLFVAILAGLANRDFIGNDLSTIALWYGVPTVGTIALWVGCILMIRRRANPQSCHGIPGKQVRPTQCSV